MSAKISLNEIIHPRDNDPIELQLHTRSGHSGYHGVKYSIGAERLVCSNGMTAFVDEHTYEQTHSDPFKPQLAHHAVDSMVDGVETVQTRLEEAQTRELTNRDEALIVLHDLGIDEYLANPVPDLLTAIDQEIENPDNPSLYETYNAATYALTHLTSDQIPEYVLDQGFERAAGLLEYGNGIPNPDILAENAVYKRATQLIEDSETDEYWTGERESLRDLMKHHNVEVRG